MVKKILTLLFIFPLLAFCNPPTETTQDDNAVNPADPGTDPSGEEDPVLTITSEKEFNFSAEGGTEVLVFTTNKDWTVEPGSKWLQVTPASGSAGENISVQITCEKTGKQKKRSSDITLSIPKKVLYVDITQDGDPMAGAAPEFKSGDVLQANSELTEKFLTEVTYEDKTYKDYTKIFDYYGGFDGENLTWDNWATDWPDGDMPCQYSIRWSKDQIESGKMTLHMEDELGWSGEMDIAEGSLYVNITNLVPNDKYTYSVTAASGKVLAQGNFTTKGSLHQVYFLGDPAKGCIKGGGGRNARDFGGWKTLDGKTIKYRKIYRGGRLNEKWTPYPLNKQGEKEVLFEGIGAELDLRGNSDVMFTPAVEGLDHCAPVIEQGGKTMLVNDKEKTKECFMFVYNSVKNNKPVYFHCSLGRDRTGTLGILILGLLGVPEGDIGKEYELTYFAPVGYSVSISDKNSNPKPLFKNTRMAWVYSDVVPYFWELAGENGTFAQGVEKYLLDVAGVSQADIDDFRKLMLE